MSLTTCMITINMCVLPLISKHVLPAVDPSTGVYEKWCASHRRSPSTEVIPWSSVGSRSFEMLPARICLTPDLCWMRPTATETGGPHHFGTDQSPSLGKTAWNLAYSIQFSVFLFICVLASEKQCQDGHVTFKLWFPAPYRKSLHERKQWSSEHSFNHLNIRLRSNSFMKY